MEAMDKTIYPVLFRVPNRQASKIINSPFTALLMPQEGDETFDKNNVEQIKKKVLEEDDDGTTDDGDARMERMLDMINDRQDRADERRDENMRNIIGEMREGFRQERQQQEQFMLEQFGTELQQRDTQML